MADYTLRLGKIMPYTDNAGVSHSDSFWCLESLTSIIGGNRLRVEFIGFHNIESYNAEKQPIAGAVKTYEVDGFQAFHNVVDQPVTLPYGQFTPIGMAIIVMAWGIALSTLEGTPGDIINEPDTRVSFFHDAVDANPPLQS